VLEHVVRLLGAECVPSAHTVHAEAPNILAYVPCPHVIHDVVPTSEYVPGPHTLHCDAPVVLLNEPPAHDEQLLDCVVFANVPATHGLHVDAPRPEYVPRPHGRHVVASGDA